MSTQIAELVTAFTAQTTEIDRAFSSLDKKFNVFEQLATGAVRRVGELITDGIGKAFETVGDIAKAGIDFNSMQEQAETAFTTMLGSAEKAQSFLNEMQAFAKKTPFEYPDLLIASRRLMALGFSADEVLPTLENIGNAVAAMGGNQEMIDRVTTALGQMKAKGKVQAEEMMQLSENGIAGWDMLAKYLNVDIATAMDMVTKRQVDASTGIAAIQAGISERFGGMMEKQSTSWAGMISNLKDSFGMLSGKVMKPLFDRLKVGLEWLVNFTSSEQFTAGVERFTERFANGLQFLSDAVGRFASDYWVELKILTSENTSFGEKLVAVWDMIYSVGLKIFTSLADSLGKLLPQWLEGLGEWATAIWDWIVESTPKALEALWEWAKGLWGWLAENLPTWAANLWEWAKATWQWIVDVTPAAVAAMLEWGRQLRLALNTFFFSLGPEVSGLWIIVTNIFDAAYRLVTGQWNIFWSDLENGYRAFETLLLPTLREWGIALWQWIVDVTPVALAKLGEWGRALWDWLKVNAPIWWDNLKKWATLAWQWIVEVTPEVLKQLGIWGTAIWQFLVDNGPSWLGPLGEWAIAAYQWIADAVSPVRAALGAWGGAIWGWLNVNGATWTARLREWGDIANWLFGVIGGLIGGIWSLFSAIGGILAPILVAAANFVTFKDVVVGSVLALAAIFAPTVAGMVTAFVAAWAPVAVVFAAAILGVAALRTAWETDWLGIQTKTTEAVDYIKLRFGPLLSTIGEFGLEALGEIAAWATGTETDFNAVTTIVDAARTTFDTLWRDFSTEFPKTALVISEAAIDISDNWKIMSDYVGEKTSGLTQAITDFGVDSLVEIGKWVTGQETDFAATKTIWNEFSETVSSVASDLVTTVLPPVGMWFATTFPNATAATIVAMQQLETSWAIMNTKVGESFATTERDYSTFVTLLQTTLDTGLAYLVMETTMMLANLGLSFAALGAAASGDWDNMWLALNQISENQNAVLYSKQKFQLAALATLMTSGGTEIASGLGKGINAGAGDADDAVGAMAGGISGTFERALLIQSPSRVFEDYGVNVVKGFEDGFNSQWAHFRSATNTTVTSWTNWFKNVFGIHSPSTVFAEHGANIVAGLAKGINGAQDMVYGAMGDLSAGMNASISTNADYAYASASSDTGASEDMALMRENNQLLRMLIAALNAKNMTANVTVAGGGGDSLGALTTYAAMGRS